MVRIQKKRGFIFGDERSCGICLWWRMTTRVFLQIHTYLDPVVFTFPSSFVLIGWPTHRRTNRWIQRSLLFIRQGRWWIHYFQRTWYCHALSQLKSHRSRTSRYGKFFIILFCAFRVLKGMLLKEQTNKRDDTKDRQRKEGERERGRIK